MKRPFRAHVTLGRLRSRRIPALDVGAPEPGEWAVDRVELVKSDLDHAGAVYTALERIPLEPAAAAAPATSHPGFNRERG